MKEDGEYNQTEEQVMERLTDAELDELIELLAGFDKHLDEGQLAEKLQEQGPKLIAFAKDARSRILKLEGAISKISTQVAAVGMDRVLDINNLSSKELQGLKKLTKRENEVLRGLVTGSRVKNIAEDLDMAPNTVRNHLKAIFAKLNVRSQSELIGKLRRLTGS